MSTPYDVQSEESKALDQREHNSDASAKRVVIRYQDPGDGEWYNYVPGDVSPSTPTVTTVDDSASSVTIIASNSDRKEVEFVNLSAANLYLRKGTTAATTSSGGFTVRIPQYGYYTSNYTGAFRGIWDADAGGAVSITETL